MIPVLNFYANHTLDFEHNDIASMEYHTISELSKTPIPGEVLHIVYDSLLAQFPSADLSKFTGIETWAPLSAPGVPKIHIVLFGPMGIRFIVTPYHLILPSIIYDCVEWYSPDNKDEVQIVRSYYKALINLFGGDHALYVDENIINKHYPHKSTLNAFEQILISKYGTSQKTLFDYAHGKYPKYYIDNFTGFER
jgi:hypothetical protein